jgi:dephospho-CoA kinase
MGGLRVGLTGGLGSGKSTVGAMLKELGAYVLSADEMGRKLMEPGQAVFAAIVEHFGPGVVRADGAGAGELDRPALAKIAFADGRVEELNAIVHPATIGLQVRITDTIFERDPQAVVVVESALIFETKYLKNWRERFDKLVLVTAPEDMKIARFVARAISQSGGGDRAALEVEAKRRLAQMIPDAVKAAECDFVIANDGTVEDLQKRVNAVWQALAG